MRPAIGAALVGLGLIASFGAAAAGLGPVVASYGNWDVHRAADMMTDRISCIGTYKHDPGIQLSRTAFYVKVRQSPRDYRYRIDDDPIRAEGVSHGELPWRMRAIFLQGPAFQRIITARRLRLEVVTRHGMQQFDLNLDGISSAYSAVYYCR